MKYRIDVNNRNNALQFIEYKGIVITATEIKTEKRILGCKEAMRILGPSKVLLNYCSDINNKAVYMETDSDFECTEIESYKEMKYIIHIDKNRVYLNQKNFRKKIDEEIPCCYVLHDGIIELTKSVKINGQSIIVRDINNPLPNGGTLWIGTNNNIEYENEKM